MSKVRTLLQGFLLTSFLFIATLTNAPAYTIPVIDVSAIPQWITQIAGMAKQLAEQIKIYEEAVKQYETMYAQLKSMTGKRGYEKFLMGQIDADAFAYLPPDISQNILNMRASAANIAKLGAAIDRAKQEVTSLTKSHFKDDQAPGAAMWKKRVDHLAQMRASSNAAADASMKRISQNEGLIKAIAGTDDPKSIAEVQARMTGQHLQLANEQARLYALAMQHHSDDEILVAMQADMLANMDQKPMPKVAYGKK